MRVLGYIMLHYGSDYLDYAIRSIEAECEKIIILHSAKPSHGTGTDIEYPDDVFDLYHIVRKHPKCVWITVNAGAEGDHRGKIWDWTDGYDILINVDSDEVWEPTQLRAAIEKAATIDNKVIGVNGFKHFWRSFNHVVEPDFFTPVRLFNLRSKHIRSETLVERVDTTIYHFGYAIQPEMMRYKLSIHGHHNELKPGYFDTWNNWKGERKGLWHPTSNQIWFDIVDFDKTKLPKFMCEHPYYNLDIIK